MENKQYSILIIALYCYTGHVKSVVEHLKKKNPLVEITLLSNLKPEEIRKYIPDPEVKIEWFDDGNGADIIKWKWLKFQIIKYRQIKFFKQFSKSHKYDIVNIHFARKSMAYVYKYLRAMCNKLVITPWGSDILRIGADQYPLLGKLYKQCDYLATFPNSLLGEKIIKEFNIPSIKFVENFFGSDLVDYAMKFGDNITEDEAKKHFGLNDRYVITCGYNKYVSHRHCIIIDAIGKVRNMLPDNLTLLFPMTYGECPLDYIQTCKNECAKRNLNAVFITEYQTIENLYMLRKATDMFVHIQTTDASAGSVMEYILCDKKIVHGSWMNYPEFAKSKPLFYFPVNDIEQLGDVIVNAYKSEKIKQSKETMDFVKSCGWETKAARMNDFFMSIV